MATRVFCSYRSTDKARVLDIARQLRANGIDVWIDEWEITPGDDFVASINQGLERCDIGLVFFSLASIDGQWQQAEINALTVLAIEESRRVIPILLDPGVRIPPLLRPRSYVGAADLDRLLDAIRRHGAPAGTPPDARTLRIRRFTIHLQPGASESLNVSHTLDGVSSPSVPVPRTRAFNEALQCWTGRWPPPKRPDCPRFPSPDQCRGFRWAG